MLKPPLLLCNLRHLRPWLFCVICGSRLLRFRTKGTAIGAGVQRFSTLPAEAGLQGLAVLDAGLKASSIDSGMPTVWQRPEFKYVKAADDHGVLEVPADSSLALGDALMLVPGHCDPTVNLYDDLVCIRGDRVEAIWPIAARGALL